jgi:hypothetical protein
LPHPNRQRKTMQSQKAAVPVAFLWCAINPPHPHKEREAGLGDVADGVFLLDVSGAPGK